MSSRDGRSTGRGGREPRVGIVGTGVSGICLAAMLQRAGFENYTMFEKADDVGGTWRDNRYPGLTCDVASRFYSFTFAPNPAWSQVFAPGREIHAYLRQVAEDFDVLRHVKFGTEVTAARWDGTAWVVTDSAGDETEFDFLVSAIGLLHHPSFPSIPGIDSFAGDIFHTARWQDVPLQGRRVAVIGTGSSGVQIVNAIAGEVSELTHFCRTPQWILPMFNPKYSALTKRLMRRIPQLDAMAYHGYRVINENMAKAPLAPGWRRRLLTRCARLHLWRVRDRELRAALTPDYDFACKRVIVSSGYYSAIQQPHVSVISTGIDRIDPTGITTSDGIHHEVDVIVLATGFEFFRPMRDVVGENGHTLEEAWAGSPKNYLTVAVAGFPNFFMVNGPPLGNTSLCSTAEAQAGYVVKWLEMFRDGRIDRAVVRQAAQDRFQSQMRELFPQTSWLGGCQSYYLSADNTPVVLPMPFDEVRQALREVNLDDFEPQVAASSSA